MPEENPSGETTVSREAHQRMTAERDQYKAQADELGKTLKELGITRKLEDHLAGKVADPRVTAELLLPHVRDVEVEKLGEHFESDAFKQRMAVFAAAAPPPDPKGEGEGDKGGDETPPADPGPGFAGPGPNPGSGGQAPDGSTKLTTKSPEYQQALQDGNHEQLQKWHDNGLVTTPPRPY